MQPRLAALGKKWRLTQIPFPVYVESRKAIITHTLCRGTAACEWNNRQHMISDPYDFDVRKRLFVIHALMRNIEHFLYRKFDYDEKWDYADDESASESYLCQNPK
jgi:hypothetical protein